MSTRKVRAGVPSDLKLVSTELRWRLCASEIPRDREPYRTPGTSSLPRAVSMHAETWNASRASISRLTELRAHAYGHTRGETALGDWVWKILLSSLVFRRAFWRAVSCSRQSHKLGTLSSRRTYRRHYMDGRRFLVRQFAGDENSSSDQKLPRTTCTLVPAQCSSMY